VEREETHARRPGGRDYIPLVVAGALIVLFCVEHIIALLRGHEVAPAWN
jgi:TRAP-type C4-dicarboxylate transport system permease small subunit